MKRKYLNDPTLFLHFCDYTPIEEDLEEMFVPSLIEIGQLFHFKIISNIQI
jgi:hypothetical protein